MNNEAEYRYREQKAAIAELGEDDYRVRNLQNFKLKAVIKESHVSPVQALEFNLCDASCRNLVACVGKDLVTLYDDGHLSEFVAVVAQLSNRKTAHSKGGDIYTCAWLNSEGLTQHPHGDACLAVAGAEGEISVISVAECRVTCMLQGHASAVVDLSAAAEQPGILASLAKDGTLKVWDVARETCLATHATDAACLAIHPTGRWLVTGSKRGTLKLYHIPLPGRDSTVQLQAPSGPNGQVIKMKSGTSHGDTVDCLRFLPGGRLASKSGDGTMNVWDFDARSVISSWKVPSGGMGARCAFGSTADGRFICVGNSQGHVYIYDSSSGARMTHVAPGKVSAPVRACGLSQDCRHLLVAMGQGFIFRHEACIPAPKAEAPAGAPEGADVEMQAADSEP
ncbi:hypothetical protein WJX73_006418 [Symbiochloris irregularis]|uniref:Uncharacterized protein n=1 Tax=Symbiochloris irregularis TaxID=706552 RepID=A0AAW1PBJ6_9CHLO